MRRLDLTLWLALRGRKSQSLVEYAIILALVALAIVVALASLGGRTSDSVGNTANVLAGLGSESEPDPDPEVHVGIITLEVHIDHGHVRGRVTVFDQDGVAVSGATVNIDWFVNGTFSTSESHATDSGGRASFALGLSGLVSGDVVRLTVVNISASGYDYAPASNVETSDEVVFP